MKVNKKVVTGFMGIIAIIAIAAGLSLRSGEGWEVKKLVVRGNEFTFDPRSITVDKGDVEITFINDGEIAHNFVIGDFGVTTETILLGSTTVKFTADRSGTFPFWCSVPGHREAGMEGEITISNSSAGR